MCSSAKESVCVCAHVRRMMVARILLFFTRNGGFNLWTDGVESCENGYRVGWLVDGNSCRLCLSAVL